VQCFVPQCSYGVHVSSLFVGCLLGLMFLTVRNWTTNFRSQRTNHSASSSCSTTVTGPVGERLQAGTEDVAPVSTARRHSEQSFTTLDPTRGSGRVGSGWDRKFTGTAGQVRSGRVWFAQRLQFNFKVP